MTNDVFPPSTAPAEKKPVAETARLAQRLRAHVLRMVYQAKASHVGSCLSMADLVAALYGGVLRVRPDQPDWPDRDFFILSKGHAAAMVYAALAERGFFDPSWLDAYCKDGAMLAGHIMRHGVPGVEAATGSLGHGLSIGCGLALAATHDGRASRAFVMLSDGELDEGSNWEAILFAGARGLDNLVAIVDYNKIQSFGRVSEVLDLAPLADKWRAARWAVREIDGHDHNQIQTALSELPLERGRPTVIIAHTIKGKGVSFMEDQLLWHYRSPTSDELTAALQEVEAL